MKSHLISLSFVHSEPYGVPSDIEQNCVLNCDSFGDVADYLTEKLKCKVRVLYIDSMDLASRNYNAEITIDGFSYRANVNSLTVV